ncbi:hypothetical protein, partial [Staphylococcus aureus]|uniref:hypothetical protein n=1 Tax=Staphylococcus aureus TaxID=1280 RepID=UPI001C83A00F
SVLGPFRQLALSVEFLFEILYVGAPPTCTLLYADFSSASVLGPRQLVKTLKTIISIKSGIDMTVFTLINNIVF